MTSKRVAALLLIALVAVTMISGCGSDNGSSSQDTSPVSTVPRASSTSPSSATGDGSSGMIYLVKGGIAVSVKREGITGGTAALKALLAGPTAAEAGTGITTDIPKGTTLLSYSIAGGTAKADFSKEMLSFGGGSQMVEMITEQVKATVLANEPTAKTVAISIQGVPADEAMQP